MNILQLLYPDLTLIEFNFEFFVLNRHITF